MSRNLTLPPIAEWPINATVVAIRTAVGDFLRRGQPYLEIETEKVILEIPAPYDLFVLKICVSLGQEIAAGDELVIIDPRDDLSLCEVREQRSHISTGIRYLTTRTLERLCYRIELGEFTFGELEPFVSKVLLLARELSPGQLDSMPEPVVIDLRETLYRVTTLLTQVEGFELQAMEKPSDYWHLVRTVSDSQDILIRRLLRLSAAIRGAVQSPDDEFRQAGAVYNPGRAYVFISCHHDDAEVALRISDSFYEAGIAHFFYEKAMPWGEEIPKAIHTALTRASHIVVVITPGSVRSAWVAYEVGFARGAKKKTIVPYLQDPHVELPGFMHNIRQLRRIEDENDLNDFVKDLQGYRRMP